jgi:hypothetical protein
VPYESCTEERTYNNGLNQCKSCEPNCLQCLDFDGRCAVCEEGFLLLAGYCTKSNPDLEQFKLEAAYTEVVEPEKKCIKVGPKDSEDVRCVEQAFNHKRIVPEYEAELQSIDWREWQVVREV